MNRNPYTTLLAMALIFVAQPVPADNEDDHPLLGRYPGATNTNVARSVEFDIVELPAGPVSEDGPEQVIELEGRIRWDAYAGPEGVTEIAIGRSYEAALEDAGFEMLFACTGADCGDLTDFLTNRTFRDMGAGIYTTSRWSANVASNERSRFYLARRVEDEKTVHVLLYISRRFNNSTQMNIGQVIVESEPLEIREIEIGALQADELQEALEEQGRVAVPGIFFALDSDQLQPESAEALEQMAALLDRSGYQVIIAGHTDSQGGHDYNMDLSERRAQAVRQTLIDDYHIDGGRMAARGFGPTEPVASNDSEEGRARNRRVELVLAQ